MSAVLEVRNLSAGYGQTRIVDDVSFTVEQGDVLCLLGLNGAGKTTLLKAIMGLLPYSGSVHLNGRDITRLTGARINRAGLSYVPQEHGVFPGISVEEHLKMARHFHDSKKAQQDEVMELFPVLKERMAQDAQTLSGGQRKMLGFVMALSSNPSLVLLDEPTEGVAPAVREQLVDALREISKRVSVVLVEQNLDTAVAIAGKCHIVEQGRIVESGNIREMHEKGIIEERLTV